jgi:hypothetical protein
MLFFADSPASRVQITISGIPNLLNYYLIFMVFICNTNWRTRMLDTPALQG